MIRDMWFDVSVVYKEIKTIDYSIDFRLETRWIENIQSQTKDLWLTTDLNSQSNHIVDFGHYISITPF